MSELDNVIRSTEERAEMRGLEKGRAEGRVEGRAEGLADGRTEGRVEGRLDVAKEMLVDGMSTDKIVKYTGLSVEEVDALRG